MFTYGFAKIYRTQFGNNTSDLLKQVKDLNGFELTWVYFGHSFAYACCIAAAQIIGGLLLIYNRTKLIGAIVLYPILFNIVLIDLFFKIPTGATANAILFLICLSVILYNNKGILMSLILPSKIFSQETVSVKANSKNIAIIILHLFALAILQLLISVFIAMIR